MIGSVKKKEMHHGLVESLHVGRISWILVDNGDEIREEGRTNREVSISLLLDANTFERGTY